jgi:parallel beta-helix repeat protein
MSLEVKMAKASETIYIRTDGSIDPPDAPIITYDNITYTLTDNITSSGDGIVVERDNIIVDGAGYTLEGTEGKGIIMSEISNVTIKSTKIETFRYGVWIHSSSNNKISDCEISGGEYGVYLWDWNCDHNTIAGNKITKKGRGIYVASTSYNNTILENEITNCQVGVWLESSNNTVSGNSITEPMGGYEYGIRLYASSRNMISGNNIEKHQYGIGFYGFARNNTISENNITNNDNGVFFLGFSPSGNSFFQNNFIGNHQQVSRDDPHTINIWDDGYPSGGNYWSDYVGVDLYTGPYQNLTEGIGSDGIGDMNYTIDGNNVDRYPLMIPWADQTPIHPLEGQYANYAALSVVHGSIVDSLHFNLTYHKYVSPFLMYVMMRDDHTPTISYWTALNITNRYSYHCVWPMTGIVADLWFPYWIETNITIGSTVNLLNGTATVVNSRILHIEPRSVKCWELAHDEEIGSGTYIHHTFWFHKTSGLLIGEEVEVSSHQKFNITLVESNILPDYEIVAAYGSTPTIDGTISVNEWGDASSVSFNNTEVFVKQDGANLYVAFNVLNAPFHEQDAVGLYVDAENDGNSSSQPPDIIMGIYRNGTLVEGNLTEGTVTQTNVTLWTASFHSDSNMWQAEFNITYSKIGVVAGVEKTLGVVFISGSGWLPYPFTWPPEDSWDLQNDPSLWGEMTSTGHNWIPEFPSLPILLLLMIAMLLAIIVSKKKVCINTR